VIDLVFQLAREAIQSRPYPLEAALGLLVASQLNLGITNLHSE
jgi:hypothetical protein